MGRAGEPLLQLVLLARRPSRSIPRGPVHLARVGRVRRQLDPPRRRCYLVVVVARSDDFSDRPVRTARLDLALPHAFEFVTPTPRTDEAEETRGRLCGGNTRGRSWARGVWGRGRSVGGRSRGRGRG